MSMANVVDLATIKTNFSLVQLKQFMITYILFVQWNKFCNLKFSFLQSNCKLTAMISV